MQFQNLTDKISFLLLAILFWLPVAGLQAASDNITPEQTIVTLQDALLQTMQIDAQSGYHQRLALLAPVIIETHDLPAIIRTALGAHWTELTTEQQQAVTDAFQKNSTATYADRFNEYDGEHFEIVEQQQLPRGRELVRSRLIQADNNAISFDYVLHPTDANWKIINIVVDGVSDLALKRTEYSAIVQKEGIAALINMLQQKTTEIEQQHP